MTEKQQMFRQRRLRLVCFLLVLTAVCVTDFRKQVVAARDSDAARLRQLKTVDWPKAYREQDVPLLDKILAEEFEMISDDGSRSSKRDELAYIRKNRPTYASFHFEITRLEVFENGTAIISGIGDIRGRDAKGSYRTKYSSSNVLIKRGGEWKAISSHVSGVQTTYE